MDNLIKDEQGLIKTGTGTAVNPQFMSAQGLQQAQSFAGIPTTISSNTLSGTQTPMNLANPQPLTGADGILGTVETGATNFMTDYQQKTQQNQELAQLKAKTDTSKQTILQRMGLSKGETALTDEAYSQTVDPLEGELKAINQDIFEEQNSLRKQLEGIQNAGTLTDVQKNQQSNALKRQSAAYQADLYVKQLGIQGRYDSAKAIADRKIAMLLEQDKQDLEILKFDYEENKEMFNKQEQRAFETMWSDRERALNTKEESMKTFEATKLATLKSANENGAPLSIKTAIANAKTTEEVLNAAGQYSGDVLDRRLKIAQVVKAEEEARQVKILGDAAQGEYADIINGAAGLVPNTKKATVKTNIANAIINKDYKTAYAETANAVSDGLTGTNKTKFDDARTDIGVMVGMRDAIQDYVNAGGDIGYLKGSADNIAKRFGQLKTDPKFAALAVQLEREFQSYRNNMTGAAFSPEESAEYAKVNPRSNATLDLNLATIDGAVNQLANRVTSTVNARIPNAQKIYELANPNAVNIPLKVGDTGKLSSGTGYTILSD